MHRRIPQKIQILKFVAEQAIVSAQDINRYFFKEDKTNVIVSTLYQLGVAHMIYGLVQGGLWYINDPKLYQLLKTYFPEMFGFKVRSISAPQISHYLELNRIRLALEKSNKINIIHWMSQREILSIPPDQRSSFCPAKIPDAIFWSMSKKNIQNKYFLICERYINSTPERYREIFRSYCEREDVENRNVVYLCGSEFVRRRLLAIEERMGSYLEPGENFQFVLLEDFYKNYEITPTVKEEEKVPEIQAV